MPCPRVSAVAASRPASSSARTTARAASMTCACRVTHRARRARRRPSGPRGSARELIAHRAAKARDLIGRRQHGDAQASAHRSQPRPDRGRRVSRAREEHRHRDRGRPRRVPQAQSAIRVPRLLPSVGGPWRGALRGSGPPRRSSPAVRERPAGSPCAAHGRRMGRGARRPNQGSLGRVGATHRPSRRSRGPYRWTDDVLQAELRAFTHGRSSFPTLDGEFDDEGRIDLRCAVARGGAYWADRVGLPVPASRAPQPYTTIEAIRDAQAVIDAIGRLPGEPTLLRKMGLNRSRPTYETRAARPSSRSPTTSRRHRQPDRPAAEQPNRATLRRRHSVGAARRNACRHEPSAGAPVSTGARS